MREEEKKGRPRKSISRVVKGQTKVVTEEVIHAEEEEKTLFLQCFFNPRARFTPERKLRK